MRPIRMVDLELQYQKIQPQIDQKMQEIVASTAFIKGPDVGAFEQELSAHLGVKHTIGCANGTDALQIAMMALGLQPGDEVITADFTFIATAEVIALLGLKPVLVDVLPDTFLINPALIEKAITPRTKAIVPVHLFGQCADMEQIMEIARRHNLYVIEDNAQAISAEVIYKDGSRIKGGAIGHIGCTSFFPSKNLGCYGDGGALFTQEDELATKIKIIANHGQTKQYYHDFVGVNSRLDTLQAGILRIKLAQLDSYTAARQRAASFYDEAFANHPQLQIPARATHSTHVFHQYTLVVKNVGRDALRTFLTEKNVPAMIYYPVPLRQQKAYQQSANHPVTDALCQSVLSLPMHTELSEDQLHYIANQVKEGIKSLLG